MNVFPKKRQPMPDEANQWTVETLREHVQSLIVANDSHIHALIAANDARYSERFESSQTALQAALTAQQTAMQTAFTAQKLSVDAALAAADRAVNKAEVASEKRFEGVNEFRGTLQDQQRTLMPRAEAEFADKVLAEKLESTTKALTEKIDNIQTMVSTTTGARAGSREVVAYIIAAAGIGLALIFHFIK